MQANGQPARSNSASWHLERTLIYDACTCPVDIEAVHLRDGVAMGQYPACACAFGMQEDAHQEAVRGLQLEAAKQVSKLRQEVEAGARGLAGRAGAAWLQACRTVCVCVFTRSSLLACACWRGSWICGSASERLCSSQAQRGVAQPCPLC